MTKISIHTQPQTNPYLYSDRVGLLFIKKKQKQTDTKRRVYKVQELLNGSVYLKMFGKSTQTSDSLKYETHWKHETKQNNLKQSSSPEARRNCFPAVQLFLEEAHDDQGACAAEMIFQPTLSSTLISLSTVACQLSHCSITDEVMHTHSYIWNHLYLGYILSSLLYCTRSCQDMK